MTHASRTDELGTEVVDLVEGEKSSEAEEGVDVPVLVSGERVSNTWVICLKEGNNCPKGLVIPHTIHI